MGRGVATLSHATGVVYDDISWMGLIQRAVCEKCSEPYYEDETTECCDIPLVFAEYYNEDHQDWDWYVEGITDKFTTKYPSLTTTDSWDGNEVHIILENDLCEIAISDYCSLCSISIRPKENEYGHTGLADRFCRYVDIWMNEHISTLNRVGGFSDGTSCYEKKT